MVAWWYARDGKPVGPYDPNALQELIGAGAADSQTLFWREGMAGWSPLAAIPELMDVLGRAKPFRPAMAPAAMPAASGMAPAAPHHHSTAVQHGFVAQVNEPSPEEIPAGIIRRFFARTLDCFLAGIPAMLAMMLISFVIGILLKVADVPQPRAGIGLVVLWSALFLPIMLVVDACIYGVFGNTAGKALLGVHVLTGVGERLRFAAYFGRNLHMWLLAFGLGLPFVNLVTLAFQAFMASGGNPASYDASADRQVVARPAGAAATLTFGALFCGIVVTSVGLAVFQGYAQHQAARRLATQQVPGQPAGQVLVPVTNLVVDPNPSRSSYAGPDAKTASPRVPMGSWTNPLTQRSLKFSRDWTYSSANANNISSWIFSNSGHQARIALQYLPGSPSEIAAIRLDDLGRQSLQTIRTSNPEYSFGNGGSVSYINGHPTWAVRGARTDSGILQEVEIQFFKVDGRIWSVAIWKPQTGDAFSVECEKLYAGIVGTIL